MEILTKLLTWLRSLPTAGKISSLIALLAAAIALIFFSSCGLTKAVVKNGANGTTTEIKITTNNPTSVTTTPNVDLNYTPNH